jgi:cyclophilin family peptidyl-prolyl cis-trans isomerase
MIRGLMIAALALAFVGASEAQKPKFLPPPPAPEFDVLPQPPEATATLQTSMGDIVIRLESRRAPQTVANFIRYVKAGYYNNIRIYRAKSDFLIQMGDTIADGGRRNPLFQSIKLETDNGLKHGLGTVSLAHADGRPNSGDSTFYIDLGPNVALNPKPGAKPNTTGYAVFGKVISGLDVAQKIAAVKKKPKSAAGQEFPGEEPASVILIKKTIVTEGAPIAPPPKPR